MASHNVCIGVVASLEDAQMALDPLRQGGFDLNQVSLVGKNHPDDKHIHGYTTTGEQMRFWGGQGVVWGGLMGVLAGAGMIFVPGIGPLLAAGPLVSMIVGGVEGAAALGGIEAVFAGLLHLGFTKDSLVLYESKLKAGKWLLLVHGDTEEVVRAKEIFEAGGNEDVAVHAA
jgi:hypothetical protein